MAGKRKRYSAEFKAGVGCCCIDPAMGGVSGIRRAGLQRHGRGRLARGDEARDAGQDVSPPPPAVEDAVMAHAGL